MVTQATARSLVGLLHDLTDDELLRLTSSDNRPGLKNFLAGCSMVRTYFATTYDQSLGLMKLIKRAVGSANLRNINPDITPKRFPLAGKDVRRVSLWVEPYLDSETSEHAAARLTAAGYILADAGALAGFLYDHPEEVARWGWVLAISEGSRWTIPGGSVYVPCADVRGAYRFFDLGDFRRQLNSGYGVLVASE